MNPLPPEASPFDVFEVLRRWRQARKDGQSGDERDRLLVVQAALLWASELAGVVRPETCFYCLRRVPNVFVHEHALTCDAGPVVRRWRLAANETSALAEVLPEAERLAAPDPWAMLTPDLRPNHVDDLCEALPPDFLLGLHTETALSLLVDHVTPPALAAPRVLPMDRLGELRGDLGGPKTLEAAFDLFGALAFARLSLDDGPPTHCSWCDTALGVEPLKHLPECPHHPLVEQVEVLEDWCLDHRGADRHPCVEVLHQLHDWRICLRHLLAACERFTQDFGWNGEQAYVRAADEARFDEWRRTIREVAARPGPAVDVPVATWLGDAQRSAVKMRAELHRLLDACDQFSRRFNDDTGGRATIDGRDEATWKAARAAAEAFLRYPPVGWRETPGETPLPAEFRLTSCLGDFTWRTGEPLVLGPRLREATTLRPRHENCIRRASDFAIADDD